MNRSDIPLIAKNGDYVDKLLRQYGEPLFRATHEWQTPLRSGGAAGCKGDHADPTGTVAAGNLDGDGDPLALAHDEYLRLLEAKRTADAKLAAIVGHKRLVDIMRCKQYADEALATFIDLHRPIDPNRIDRGRVNLVPSCIVCGGPAIPIRRGMCDACRKAFERVGHDDLERFKRERHREAMAATARVHEHEVA